jgi:hypothetical protein
VHLDLEVAERALGPRIALGQDHHPGAHGEHIAAKRRHLLVRHGDKAHPELEQEVVEPARELRQIRHGQIVCNR